MRVLLLSQEYPPETGWGGIGTYAATIAPAMAAQGAEVHVLSIARGVPGGRVLRDGVHVHRATLRAPRRLGLAVGMPDSWHRLALASAVARRARGLGVRFDVCEAPDWGAESLLLGRRCPLVVRLHSGAAQIFPFRGPVRPDQRLTARLENRAIRRATLVTGTPWQATYAREKLRLPAERVRELPYPVAPIAADGPDSAPEVLYLGRLEERKGPMTLVDAMPDLLARVPEARLTLAGVDRAGDSAERAKLERRIAQLRVGHAVRLDPAWGRDAVQRHLSRAQVIAVPSRWESFGYTAAEAMSAGRAVVASDIDAFRDLIEDGVSGVLVERDPRSWATALAALLEDPDRAGALGSAAAERIRRRHDPAAVAAATLEVYEDARRG